MKRLSIALMVSFLVFGVAWAEEKPTPDEARKVIDYYYHGKGKGAILMDMAICEKVGQEEGPDKNECLDSINTGQIQLNQEVHLWMNFLVPVNDTADIILAFSRKGKVRRTANLKLAGASRYRTWKKIPTDKAGQWTVSILQELEDQDLELGSMQFTVVAASQ